MPVISTFKGCWEDWKVYVENLAECLQHLVNHNFHFLLSFKSCFFHNHLFWFCMSLWSKIRPGFSNSSRTGISGQVVLCCQGAVLYTGRCLQLPWLLPPHTHQEHQLWRPKMSLDIAKCSWENKLPLTENHCFIQRASTDRSSSAQCPRTLTKIKQYYRIRKVEMLECFQQDASSLSLWL